MRDLALVGAKSAFLGETAAALAPLGVVVPPSFTLTGDAYREHLRGAGIEPAIRELLRGAHAGDIHDLVERSDRIRDLVLRAPLPAEIARAVTSAYEHLSRAHGDLATDVAVRASAVSPELVDAFFGGQYETVLNVRGAAALDESIRHVLASAFTPRALADRLERGIDHFAIAMSVIVQKMVRSDLGSSGVVYTADPETGSKERVLVASCWGLGESLTQERVVPDRFFVDRRSHRIVAKHLGTKETKSVYDSHGHRQTAIVPVPGSDRVRFASTDRDAVDLSKIALEIEEHFTKLLEEPVAVDMEWAQDGITGAHWIVQVRRENASARRLARDLPRTAAVDVAPPSVPVCSALP